MGTLDARLIALDARDRASRARTSARTARSTCARASATREPGEYGVTSPPRGDRRSRRHRRDGARQPPRRCARRRGARLRRAHAARCSGRGIRCRPASRCARPSGATCATARHDERLERALGRRRARPRLRADRQHLARLLRRPARRRSTTTRARSSRSTRDSGEVALALPDRAPRRLGLRRRRRSRRSSSCPGRDGPVPGARRRPRRWAICSCSIARRASRCSRSRSGRCRRRARCRARRSRRRSRSRRSRAPLHPATLAADDAFGFTPWDRGEVPRGDRGAALRRHLHAADARGLDPVPGHGRRHELGQRRGRPAARRCCVVNTQRIATQHPAGAARRVRRAQLRRRRRRPTASSRRRARPTRSSACRCSRRSARRAIRRRGARSPRSTSRPARSRWEVPLGTTRDLAPLPVVARTLGDAEPRRSDR